MVLEEPDSKMYSVPPLSIRLRLSCALRLLLLDDGTMRVTSARRLVPCPKRAGAGAALAGADLGDSKSSIATRVPAGGAASASTRAPSPVISSIMGNFWAPMLSLNSAEPSTAFREVIAVPSSPNTRGSLLAADLSLRSLMIFSSRSWWPSTCRKARSKHERAAAHIFSLGAGFWMGCPLARATTYRFSTAVFTCPQRFLSCCTLSLRASRKGCSHCATQIMP
mmetsp:Transcript_25920/g.66002  ORF Transcript_25920/g.66002 Transcript_25920/m.66002 type:complete len:223 (+) Transcript_25920:286-954(+)